MEIKMRNVLSTSGFLLCCLLLLRPVADADNSAEDGGSFTCLEGTVLMEEMHCDGITQCEDGSDEDGCPSTGPCPIETFVCEEDKLCLPLGSVCDSVIDCRDGSDEKNCDAPQT